MKWFSRDSTAISVHLPWIGWLGLETHIYPELYFVPDNIGRPMCHVRIWLWRVR